MGRCDAIAFSNVMYVKWNGFSQELESGRITAITKYFSQIDTFED